MHIYVHILVIYCLINLSDKIQLDKNRKESIFKHKIRNNIYSSKSEKRVSEPASKLEKSGCRRKVYIYIMIN